MGKPVVGEMVVLPFPQTNEAPRGAWRNSEAFRVNGSSLQRCERAKNRVVLQGAVMDSDEPKGKVFSVGQVAQAIPGNQRQ